MSGLVKFSTILKARKERFFSYDSLTRLKKLRGRKGQRFFLGGGGGGGGGRGWPFFWGSVRVSVPLLEPVHLAEDYPITRFF